MKPGKRSAAPAQHSAKRRKRNASTSNSKSSKSSKADGTRKEKAFNRPVIPIPNVNDDGEDGDSNLSDQDIEVLQNYGKAASFLNSLDRTGISRSKKETARLHQLQKPIRPTKETDDLPSVHSDSEGDDDEWDSDLDDHEFSGIDDLSNRSDDDSDLEMPYESKPRIAEDFKEPKIPGVQRLPIKLNDGTIRSMGRNASTKDAFESEQDGDEILPPPSLPSKRIDDVSTGARFGRAAVVDVITQSSRKARVQEAKEQIASICQDIVAEPEMSLGLLRRLHVFASETVTSPSHPEPIKNDPIIRKLAILSQLAVFTDIIPGYRIRALTDQEKAEKVSQQVARTREWEQGLVGVYQGYLRILEAELKARSELADACLTCLCTLVQKATHFNFVANIMACIIGRLSRKSWDKSSDMCLDALIEVFRSDATGQPSLEVVRLLNRMIKEKRYNIHPNVLTCLPYLRLKTELSVRASDSKTDKPIPQKKDGKRAKGAARRKIGDAPHLSKRNTKLLKEKKEIDKEFREAEAEVDREQRASTQTETLKLLFVLYFSILKATYPTPLLPNALEGIAKFAHLVNIDFFKDLLQVLKKHIEVEDLEKDDLVATTYHRLICIITAFDLLSGQGEALNIDLSDFVSHLYSILQPLSLVPNVDRPIIEQGGGTTSLANKLFRALEIVFNPRSFGTAAPSWRSAAFAKRLLGASLQWPPALALRSLDFVDGLMLKDEKLEALLVTEERSLDGVYRPDIDDPQLCNPFGTSFWELYALRESYYDTSVRDAADKIIRRAQESR